MQCPRKMAFGLSAIRKYFIHKLFSPHSFIHSVVIGNMLNTQDLDPYLRQIMVLNRCCWIDVEQLLSPFTCGSPSRGVLWSLRRAAKSKKERKQWALATLRALSFGQRVQGGFTGKSFTARCQLYIWVSPSVDLVLISPKIQRSLWKCLKHTLNYQDLKG